MKLVIDIPDKIYNTFQRGNWSVTYSGKKIRDIVMNGTPLPKGHGDLKDADRLLDSFFYEYCRYGDFGYRQAEDLIKSSLTIIEADKEKE